MDREQQTRGKYHRHGTAIQDSHDHTSQMDSVERALHQARPSLHSSVNRPLPALNLVLREGLPGESGSQRSTSRFMPLTPHDDAGLEFRGQGRWQLSNRNVKD